MPDRAGDASVRGGALRPNGLAATERDLANARPSRRMLNKVADRRARVPCALARERRMTTTDNIDALGKATTQVMRTLHGVSS